MYLKLSRHLTNINKVESNYMAKEKKLVMTPASGLAKSNALSVISGKVPEKGKLKKLNLPPLVKFGDRPGQIAVGVTVSGALVGFVDNFTGKSEMRGTKTIHIKHESGEEFLLPLTGGIKSTFRQLCDDKENLKPEYIGKLFFFTRRSDGVSKKYNGKAMFNVDVVMAED